MIRIKTLFKYISLPIVATSPTFPMFYDMYTKEKQNKINEATENK